MFSLDEDDSVLRTKPVSPNEVLVISSLCKRSQKLDKPYCQTQNNKFTRVIEKDKANKSKETKIVCFPAKNGQPNVMSKKGDPFLPSLAPDESPLVEYPIKHSRKKPSDCKCKGSGYNSSPSTLLPEEMKQQWGAGVFGKPTYLNSRISITSGGHCFTNSYAVHRTEDNCVNGSYLKSASNSQNSSQTTRMFAPNHIDTKKQGETSQCHMCLESSCICNDFPLHGFRTPSKQEGRKMKTSAKAQTSKNRETNIVQVLPSIKKVPNYDCKENSNIISTVNYTKNIPTSTALDRKPPYNYTIPPSYDNGYIKAGFSYGQKSSRACYNQTYDPGEFSALTNKVPRSPHTMHRSRRVLSDMNMNTPPFMQNETHNSSYDRSQNFLQHCGAQVPMMSSKSQNCSCSACRSTGNFIPGMDSIEFPITQPHQIMPPAVMSHMQNYKQAPTMSTQTRFHPYSANNFQSYQRPQSLYNSPDVYSCQSPEFDFDSQPYQVPLVSSTPLSLAQNMNGNEDPFQGFDSDVLFPEVNGHEDSKDILDLSIKDTVDFFVTRSKKRSDCGVQRK